MPEVNGMKFPYDKAGVQAAQQAATKQGGQSIMDMNENPFMQFVSSGAPTQQTQPMPQAQGNGQPATAQVVEGTEPELSPAEMQLQKGQNPSQSPSLLKAISSLEQFASESTDPQDLALVRGILSALSRLLGKNQDNLRELL